MTTIVPGAILDITKKKTRRGGLVWTMPRPTRYVKHFRSAGTRRRFERGEISMNAATLMVPVYRGIDYSLLKILLNDERRRRERAIREGRGVARLRSIVREMFSKI